MIAYIKDINNFSTKHYGQAYEYDIYRQSIYDDDSEIIMDGVADNVADGDILYIDGYLGIIQEHERETENTIKIQAKEIRYLFDRELYPTTDTCADGIEDFLARQITENYIDLPDPIYTYPWLSVRAASHTPATIAPDEGDTWTITDFFDKARRMYNIHLDFAMGPSGIALNIVRKTPSKRNIFLGTANFELEDEAYSNDQVGRVSVLCEDTGEILDWYMLQDGTITDIYTAENRVRGKWEHLTVGDKDNAQDKAMDAFAKSEYSHLIEFWATETYDFCAPVMIRTAEGRVFSSYISAIRMVHDDNRICYSTGELRLTLTEKLKIQGGF